LIDGEGMKLRWNDARARGFLHDIFMAAIASADPRAMLSHHLPEKPEGRCIVVGCGKSAASMAASLEAAWPDVAMSGLVVTRYGHEVPTRHIEVMQSAHPVPDANSEIAAHRMLETVRGLTADDLVIALISGGGSALMALPAPGLTLADKQSINRALLASGATIGEMNCVRRHLSAIKGGRLAAAAAPARLITLAISDVPGDDPAVIASGPTVADPTSFADARAILARYAITPTPAMAEWMAHGDETPKPGSLDHASFRLIATPAMALDAAAAVARAHGVTPIILGDALEGESREMGIILAGIARSIRTHGQPATAPALLLSGGETTVSIGRGPAGRGGRNTECLLALAVTLNGAPGIWAIAGDTDGIDGTEDAAGAIVTPDTLSRARTAGLDARAILAAHDSYSLFDALGDLVRTGPTLTNVNDIRAILVV
jgi:hydroxypyruvate reductase